MAAEGIDAVDALMALSSAVLTAIGLVLVESTLTVPDGTSALKARFERLKEWSETSTAQDDTETRKAVSEVRHFELDRVFEVTISSLVVGFEAYRGRGGRDKAP